MTPVEKDFARRYGPYFSFAEMACKCGERYPEPLCDPQEGSWFRSPEFKEFMGHMVAMREQLGFPFAISSGHRCPDYNQRVSSTGSDGPHTIAAGDVKVAYGRAYSLAALAFSRGLGVGIAQKGSVASRFIHIDNLGQRLWSY